jgi:hypothetical protein
MKNLTITIISLLALILSSCTEVIEPIINTPLPPENSLNAYDYYGQQHNDQVQYLLDNYEDEIKAMQSTDPLAAEAFIFEKAFEHAQLDSFKQSYEAFRRLLDLREDQTLNNKDYLDLEKLTKTPPFNPYEMTQFQNVIDEVSQMPHSTTKEVNAIITAIIAFETKYMNDDRIVHEEPFFGGLSVMRHSAVMWSGDNLGGGPTPTGKAKWWQTLLGDVAGALVGGLVGGPGGAIAISASTSTAVALSD